VKTISITLVKNEEDIIESFVRYHINFFDKLLIMDTGSTDATLDILKKLSAENLPIVIIEKAVVAYNQKHMNY